MGHREAGNLGLQGGYQDLDKVIDNLEASRTQLVEAIVDDGWPRPMAEEGVQRHLETWDAETIYEACKLELKALKKRDCFQSWTSDGRLLWQPRSPVYHVWPALPGAGVTPVLFGIVLGTDQYVQTSSHSRAFAECFAGICGDVLDSTEPFVELVPSEAEAARRAARLAVVSGSDETVKTLWGQFELSNTQFIDYGHAVSIGVVVDDETLDIERLARRFATDTVLWHQQGCFSLRGVVFCGERARFQTFLEAFGEALEREESALGASDLQVGDMVKEASGRTVRAMRSEETYGDGKGFCYDSSEPITGEIVAPHAVPVRRIDDADKLDRQIAIPRNHLQAVALTTPSSSRPDWKRRLADLGATRICSPGMLQQPSGAWPHDGRFNLSEWLELLFDESGRDGPLLA
jgi:hypothetical protein